MFLVFLLYALFASVFTIGKVGLQHTEPFFFVGSRMVAAGVILLGYQFLFQRSTPISLKKNDLWYLFLLALTAIYMTNIFEFWGLQYLTSFKACFIYSLSPFVSALLSYWMLSETMSSKKWLGLLIGFIGFVPILLSQSAEEGETGHLGIFSWAEIALMIAAVASVYGWVVLRHLVKERGQSPIFCNGISMLIGGAAALAHSYAVEDWNPVPITGLSTYIECTLLLIIISNLIAYNLYGHLLKKFSATFLSFAGFTTPLFTALFGWLYLGEVVTWPFFASAAIVFCGLTLFYQEELQGAPVTT